MHHVVVQSSDASEKHTVSIFRVQKPKRKPSLAMTALFHSFSIQHPQITLLTLYTLSYSHCYSTDHKGTNKTFLLLNYVSRNKDVWGTRDVSSTHF